LELVLPFFKSQNDKTLKKNSHRSFNTPTLLTTIWAFAESRFHLDCKKAGEC